MIEPQEKELQEIATAFENKLPEKDLTDIRELIDAREWGIGLENLCKDKGL